MCAPVPRNDNPDTQKQEGRGCVLPVFHFIIDLFALPYRLPKAALTMRSAWALPLIMAQVMLSPARASPFTLPQ